ncbi:MAG: hypothetical protein C0503_07725 [Gemmatimonas sp.]|nr:hypothetical protein [Gemmatimonas sp.]
MSRFLPADHSKGDESTVGGYEAVHARPAALDAPDGFPYSIARMVDPLHGDPRGAWAAYLMFLRWRRIGEEGVEGHVETEYLEFAATREDALDALGAWPLRRAQDLLNGLLAFAEPAALDDDEDDA